MPGSQFLLFEILRKDYFHNDPFSGFSELCDYDIHAGDGNYHAAAAHDVTKFGKKYPTQHLYSVDLRTHGLKHLTLAEAIKIRSSAP